jgi:thiol-disulfide isomerase/thioredoxin
MKTKLIFILVLLLLAGLLFGCGESNNSNPFSKVEGNSICKEDGKPVIRMISTTWCPHCEWIKPTFDEVAKEYVDQGKIVAYHWQVDTGDNTLTTAVEDKVPDTEMNVYTQFNPKGSIPTFVFGCKYYRIGNGFESQKDLNAERNEIRRIIDQVIADAE